MSSYEDVAKKGKQEYNRDSHEEVGRYQPKETADEYNKRKAHEMLGMEQEKTKAGSELSSYESIDARTGTQIKTVPKEINRG